MVERQKPQHDILDVKRVEGTTLTPDQEHRLMEIDEEHAVLFEWLDQEYKEMHRMPPLRGTIR